MNAKNTYEPDQYRKAARTLFASVNKLMDEAVHSADLKKRRELYLQAMGISQEAYNLLGKAKKLTEKSRPKSAKV